MFIQVLDARTIYDVFPFMVVSQDNMWQIKTMWFDKFWLKCGEKVITLVINYFANMLTYLDIQFKVSLLYFAAVKSQTCLWIKLLFSILW